MCYYPLHDFLLAVFRGQILNVFVGGLCPKNVNFLEIFETHLSRLIKCQTQTGARPTLRLLETGSTTILRHETETKSGRK